MKKKAMSLVLALVMCVSLTTPIWANNTVKTDTRTVENITVTADSNGNITYTGLGEMNAKLFYDTGDMMYSITGGERLETLSVVIEEGITSITNGGFGDFANLYQKSGNMPPRQVSLTLPTSIVEVSAGVFSDIEMYLALFGSPMDIYYAGTSEQWSHISFGDRNNALRNYQSYSFITVHFNNGSTQPVPQQPEIPVSPTQPETAMPTNDKLTVDGVPANPTVYKIDGSNYFKIRDVAALLNGTSKQFSVGYDSARKSVTATTGEGYAKLDTDLTGAPAGGNQTATPSNDVIYVNGEKADLTVYKINGGNYFKLRDLGDALGFTVDWNREQGMMITTK